MPTDRQWREAQARVERIDSERAALEAILDLATFGHLDAFELIRRAAEAGLKGMPDDPR